MQVDVSFEFAKVYNVDLKIDVVKGQKFKLLTDYVGEMRIFSDNDPALSITPVANNIEVQADNTGVSTILFMNGSDQVQKKIIINVVDAIVEPVADLGVTAGDPIDK